MDEIDDLKADLYNLIDDFLARSRRLRENGPGQRTAQASIAYRQAAEALEDLLEGR